MWSKIAISTTAKMPPRPERPPQLTQYKRVRPLDQSMEKKQRRERRNSHNSSRNHDSDSSRNQSQDSAVFSRKPSVTQFSKADLSFKDENLSPIRKSRVTPNDNGTMFEIFMGPIAVEDHTEAIQTESKEIIELIQKHKKIIVELESKLDRSLNQNRRFQQLISKTRDDVQILKSAVCEILKTYESLVKDIPKTIVSISKALSENDSKKVLYQNSFEERNPNVSAELCLRCQHMKSREKSPSELMQNILKTINQVKMEISNQKLLSDKKQTQTQAKESFKN